MSLEGVDMAGRRIVAGYDGTAGSQAAVRLAAAEAGEGGALRIVHARLERPAYALLRPPGVVRSADEEARRLVDGVRGLVRREHPELNVRAVVSTAGAGAALVRVARGADLLIVGRSGTGPAGVSAHVLRWASCPVTVVGAGVAPTWDPGRPVVLGYGAGAHAAAAVPHAFRAAQARGAGLRVCHVRGPDDDGRAPDAEVRREVSEALAGWRAAFPDVAVAVDVLAGIDPAARLLDAAAGAALLVVGDHGSGRAGVLVRNADCPVTVVA
ncbi:universal stress protein [Dactylosporangium sp. CA-139066]|uniref:universal stress protein n=1 Tax=Dactylosporangium sp. CA-139066 TaxID=3239930 RepID=UPI003D922E1E